MQETFGLSEAEMRALPAGQLAERVRYVILREQLAERRELARAARGR